MKRFKYNCQSYSRLKLSRWSARWAACWHLLIHSLADWLVGSLWLTKRGGYSIVITNAFDGDIEVDDALWWSFINRLSYVLIFIVIPSSFNFICNFLGVSKVHPSIRFLPIPLHCFFSSSLFFAVYLSSSWIWRCSTLFECADLCL